MAAKPPPDQSFGAGRARAGTVQTQSLDRTAATSKSALKKGKSPTASTLNQAGSKASSNSSRVDISRPSSPPERRSRNGSPTDTAQRLSAVEKSLDDMKGLLRTLVAQNDIGAGRGATAGARFGPGGGHGGVPRTPGKSHQAATSSSSGGALGTTHFNREDQELPLPVGGDSAEYGDDDDVNDEDPRVRALAELQGRTGAFRPSVESNETDGDMDLPEARTEALLVPVVIDEDDKWMINPRNQFRMAWDLGLIMPFLVYLTVVMPFRLCFANEARYGQPVYFFEFTIDMVFLVDIIFNFRTGFYVKMDDNQRGSDDTDLVEYDRWRVAKNYLKSWFLLDVVSGIPFALIELVSGNGAGALSSIKSMKLLRFLKLGRLLKMEKILSNLDRDTLDKMEDFFQNGNTRSAVLLLRLTGALGYVCHLLACGFVAVGRVGAEAGYGLDSWLENDSVGGPYIALDTEGVDEARDDQVSNIYVAAFYFTLTTMTSVGYGDIVAKNQAERIYTIFLEFTGAIVFAMIIASLTSVVSSMDMNKRKTAEQLDSVASFVVNRGFPEGLGRRIRRHFRHFYSLKSAIDESKIFSELSTSLRKEVSAYLVSDLMGQESFFMSMSPVLWPRLLPLLRPMRFEKDELICRQDEECTEMYVVLAGRLVGETVVMGEARPRVRVVGKGNSVNVLAVLGVWHRCVETVTAAVETESYAVSSSDFANLFTAEADILAFERMQWFEQKNFKMDTSYESASTEYGRPLYYSCFSQVCITLVQARGLLAPTTSLVGTTSISTFAGETFLIVELVDARSCKPFNDVWRYRSQTQADRVPDLGSSNPASARNSLTAKSMRSLREVGGKFGTSHHNGGNNNNNGGNNYNVAEPFFGEEIRWDDVSAPFEKSAIRIRLYEQGRGGKDVLLGTAVIRLVDLEEALEAQGNREAARALETGKRGDAHSSQPPPPTTGDASGKVNGYGDLALRARNRGASQSASVLNGADEWLDSTPLEEGTLETWYELDPLLAPGKMTMDNSSDFDGGLKSAPSSVYTAASGTTSASTTSSSVQVRILAKRPERVNRRNRRVLNPINSSSQRAAQSTPRVLKPPSNGDDDDDGNNEETKVGGVRKSGSSTNGGISKVALAEAKSHTPSQQRRRGSLSHKKTTTRYHNFQEEI